MALDSDTTLLLDAISLLECLLVEVHASKEPPTHQNVPVATAGPAWFVDGNYKGASQQLRPIVPTISGGLSCSDKIAASVTTAPCDAASLQQCLCNGMQAYSVKLQQVSQDRTTPFLLASAAATVAAAPTTPRLQPPILPFPSSNSSLTSTHSLSRFAGGHNNGAHQHGDALHTDPGSNAHATKVHEGACGFEHSGNLWGASTSSGEAEIGILHLHEAHRTAYYQRSTPASSTAALDLGLRQQDCARHNAGDEAGNAKPLSINLVPALQSPWAAELPPCTASSLQLVSAAGGAVPLLSAAAMPLRDTVIQKVPVGTVRMELSIATAASEQLAVSSAPRVEAGQPVRCAGLDYPVISTAAAMPAHMQSLLFAPSRLAIPSPSLSRSPSVPSARPTSYLPNAEQDAILQRMLSRQASLLPSPLMPSLPAVSHLLAASASTPGTANGLVSRVEAGLSQAAHLPPNRTQMPQVLPSRQGSDSMAAVADTPAALPAPTAFMAHQRRMSADTGVLESGGMPLWTGNKSKAEVARLGVRLLQATGLGSGDEQQQLHLDPFAVVSCGGHKCMTKAVTKSKDPVWDEFFVFEVHHPAFADLKIKIFDHVRCWRGARLGQVLIPVKTLRDFPNRYASATWHQLRSRGGSPSGQVQIQLFYLWERIHKPLNIFCGTWNVGNAEPPEDLSSWLVGAHTGEHDLIAIGVQECSYRAGKDNFHDELVAGESSFPAAGNDSPDDRTEDGTGLDADGFSIRRGHGMGSARSSVTSLHDGGSVSGTPRTRASGEQSPLGRQLHQQWARGHSPAGQHPLFGTTRHVQQSRHASGSQHASMTDLTAAAADAAIGGPRGGKKRSASMSIADAKVAAVMLHGNHPSEAAHAAILQETFSGRRSASFWLTDQASDLSTGLGLGGGYNGRIGSTNPYRHQPRYYKSHVLQGLSKQVAGDFRDVWEDTLKDAVGPSYFMVRSVHMGQIRLLVFARNDVYAAITQVTRGVQATGVAGVATNKGGVAIGLKVWDTDLCFVNSHLAAHQDKVATRNSNYRDIIKGIRMDKFNMDLCTAYHHTFWMGDLNYRLNYGKQAETYAESPNLEDFKSLVSQLQAADYKPLQAVDQLRREMSARNAFLGFGEAEFVFPPSFKVKRKRGLEWTPQRSPAWCDRVLFRSNLPKKQAKPLAYFAATDISTSDHKPVGCVFSAPMVWRTGLDGTLSMASLSLLIENLSAQGLFLLRARKASSVGQRYPNPQVLFQSPCMAGGVVATTVLPQTRNPSWPLPVSIQLRSAPMQDVTNYRLLIRIVDCPRKQVGALAGSKGSVHTLARGVLALSDAAAQLLTAAGTSVPFKVPLEYNGQAAGTLAGSMRLVVSADAEVKASYFGKDLALGSWLTMATNGRHR